MRSRRRRCSRSSRRGHRARRDRSRVLDLARRVRAAEALLLVFRYGPTTSKAAKPGGSFRRSSERTASGIRRSRGGRHLGADRHHGGHVAHAADSAGRARTGPGGQPPEFRAARVLRAPRASVVGPGATSPFRLVVLDLYESDVGTSGGTEGGPAGEPGTRLVCRRPPRRRGRGRHGLAFCERRRLDGLPCPRLPARSGIRDRLGVRNPGRDRQVRGGHSVSIFPLQWFFRLEEQRDRACALIESPAVPTAAYTMTASVDAHFAIDADPDHKPLVIDGDRPSPDLTISPPVACPLWNQCTIVLGRLPAGREGLRDRRLRLEGPAQRRHLVLPRRGAGITATCPGFTGHLNPALGASDHSDVVVGWRGDSHTVSYAPVEGLSGLTRFTVKPTETGICP